MHAQDQQNQTPAPTERLHALDALRAVAMMLGVWLHAALPFVAGVPFFFWPFLEQTKSTPLARSVTVIHAWRMETAVALAIAAHHDPDAVGSDISASRSASLRPILRTSSKTPRSSW